MRLDHLLLRKGKISNVYFAKSIISFSEMSKDVSVSKNHEVIFTTRSLKLQRKDGKYILIPVDVFYMKESFY